MRKQRLLLLALIGLLAGMTPALALAAPEKIVLQLKWRHKFQFAGYYAAQAKGFYRDAGLDVELREAHPGSDPVQEVVDGRAQYGIGNSGLLLRRHRGDPVVVLGVVFQHSPSVLLARQQAGISVVQDLAGKKVMIEPLAVDLIAYLKQEGVTPAGLVRMPHSFTPDDLQRGTVDAVSAYETNEPFFLEQARVPFLLFTPRAAGIDFYGDNLFTTQAELDRHPARARAMRAASLRGWQYALEHPDEIIDYLLRHYPAHNSRASLRYEADRIRALIQPDMVELGYSNPGRWRHIAGVYAGLGMLPPDVALDGFLYQDTPEPQSPSHLLVMLGVLGGVAALCLLAALHVGRLNRRLRQAVREQAATKAGLRDSEARYRVFFETAPSAGVVWTEDFIITDWNHHAELTFGWTRQEVLGRHLLDTLVPEDERDRVRDGLRRFLGSGTPPQSINANLTRDGRSITCEWFNSWLPSSPARRREVISLGIDITARQAAAQELQESHAQLARQLKENQELQAKLQEQAIRDTLTGLYNRRYLDEQLDAEFARAKRHGYPLAIVMLDIDHFKRVNDTFGHPAGDAVIKALAQLLRDSSRVEDIVCRYGGEEFVLFFRDMPLDVALARIQLWRERFALLEVCHGGLCLYATFSAGIACYPPHGATPAALIAQADAALYQAKDRGRNRVEVATPPDAPAPA